MKRLKNWLRQKIINIVLEEIEVGGNCGLCGAWVPHCLVWCACPYTVCDKCATPPDYSSTILDKAGFKYLG